MTQRARGIVRSAGLHVAVAVLAGGEHFFRQGVVHRNELRTVLAA